MTAGEERARARTLQAELRRDLAVIEDLIAFVLEHGPDPARAQAEVERVYTAAVGLHHVYTALEALMERVARRLDGEVPAGPEWHRELLERMVLAIPGVRPAVFADADRELLDEYRRFRHVLRHAYEYRLDWARMRHLVALLPRLREVVRAGVGTLDALLEAIAED